MNDPEMISHIEELGLSNKEARVYVACLKTGPSAVQRIADEANIKRVTTYVILESLVGLGLVSQSVKGKKTYFIAEEPSNLRRLLEKREQELNDQKTNFDQLLPSLVGLKNIPQESPEVKFYDSADGIRSIVSTFYESYQGKVDIVYGMSNADQLNDFFPDREQDSANPDRFSRGYASKFLYSSTRGPILKTGDLIANRESRYVPYDRYPLNGDMTIIGDQVIILSLTGSRPIGVTVRSVEVAKSMLAIFNLAWDAAVQFNN